MKYIKKFNIDAEYQAAKDNLIRPNVSLCNADNEVHYNQIDYSLQYLTFVVLERGTLQFTKHGTGNDIEYSLDDGSTWTTLASNTNTPTITAGSKILWKAELTPTGNSRGIGIFSSTGRFNVQGNAMSLLFGDNFRGQTSLGGKNRAFTSLFSGCTKLESAENLSLPATTLANECYQMMFSGCSSLTTAPELPATTLADSCYYLMFDGCSSLTTAPELPATTLAGSCYYYMFQNCTSLTTAPELPATTLVSGCYWYMFSGCRNLNYIKCLATDISATNCTYSWVNGVASSGTFVKDASMTSWSSGNNGIPSGWTVQNA